MAFAPAKFSESIYLACVEKGLKAGDIKPEDKWHWGSEWFKDNYANTAIEMIDGLPSNHRVTLAKYAATTGNDSLLMNCFASGVDPDIATANGKTLLASIDNLEYLAQAEKYKTDGVFVEKDIDSISYIAGRRYGTNSLADLAPLGKLKSRLNPGRLLYGILESSFADEKIELAKWAIAKLGDDVVAESPYSYLMTAAIRAGATKIFTQLLKRATKIENGWLESYDPLRILLANNEVHRAYHPRVARQAKERSKNILNSTKLLAKAFKKNGLTMTVNLQSLILVAKYADPDLMADVLNMVRQGDMVFSTRLHSFFNGRIGRGFIDIIAPFDHMKGSAHLAELNVSERHAAAFRELMLFYRDEIKKSGTPSPQSSQITLADVLGVLSNHEAATAAKTQGISQSALGDLLELAVEFSQFGDRASRSFDPGTMLRASATYLGIGALTAQAPAGLLGGVSPFLAMVDRGMTLLGEGAMLSESLVSSLAKEERISLARHAIAEHKARMEAGSPIFFTPGFTALVRHLAQDSLAPYDYSVTMTLSRSLLGLSDAAAYSYASQAFSAFAGDESVLISEFRQLGIPDRISVAALIRKMAGGSADGGGPGNFTANEIIDVAARTARMMGAQTVNEALHLPEFERTCIDSSKIHPWKLYVFAKAAGIEDGNRGFLIATKESIPSIWKTMDMARLLTAMGLPRYNGLADAKDVISSMQQDGEVKQVCLAMHRIDRNKIALRDNWSGWGEMVDVATRQITIGVHPAAALNGLMEYCAENLRKTCASLEDEAFDAKERIHLLIDRLLDANVDFGAQFKSEVSTKMMATLFSLDALSTLSSERVAPQRFADLYVAACETTGHYPSADDVEFALGDKTPSGAIMAAVDCMVMNGEIRKVATATEDESDDDMVVTVRRRQRF